MRIHYLQHVPFEDAANIEVWARDRGYAISCTRLYDEEPFPSLDSFDWLAVMGGPMNIYEHDLYPWLVDEKKFLREAIEAKKYVIGICLGAQLVADVLGGRVEQNPQKEIGWFPVTLTESGKRSPFFEGFASRIDVFQWHGDTFTIPPGAEKLAESEACANQAFQYGGHVLGMQFHLDYSIESIEKMLQYCSDELTEALFIQSAQSIRDSHSLVEGSNSLLYRLLDHLQAMTNGSN